MKKITTTILCISFFFAGLVSAEVWKDDFEDGELGESWTPAAWAVNAPPNWEVEDGILNGKWPNWNGQMLFGEEYPSLDYTIQAKVRIDRVLQASGYDGAGFIFRSPGPGVVPNNKITSFYGFGIGANLSQFGIIHDDGNWQYVATSPEKHKIGQWYTLKLVVKGDKFIGYVNDVPICKLQDDKYKGEFVGLIIGANIDASFDDFMISDRVDDTAFTEFAVSPEDIALTTTWGSLKVK